MPNEPKRALGSDDLGQPTPKRARAGRRTFLPTGRTGSGIPASRNPAGEGLEIIRPARKHGQERTRSTLSLDPTPLNDYSPAQTPTDPGSGNEDDDVHLPTASYPGSVVPESDSLPHATGVSSSADGTIDIPKLVDKCERSFQRFYSEWHKTLGRRGLSDDDIIKITARCFQSVVMPQKGSSSSPSEALSPDGTGDGQNPRLRSNAGATLSATQLFEASSRGVPASMSRARRRQQPRPTQSDASSDDMAVVPLGGEGAEKQGARTGKTLVEALQSRRAKNGAAADLGGDRGALEMMSVASRMQLRDFHDVVDGEDLSIIGGAVLGDVFGGRGQKRLAEAFVHLYGPGSKQQLGRAVEVSSAERVATGVFDAGSEVLSDFTTQWAQAVRHDSPQTSAAEDIQSLRMKVALVRQWERWSLPARLQSDKELERFLDQRGIPHKKHAPLSSRVTKYLSDEFGFGQGQLARKIYNWTPLAIMAETFGEGVFALIPKNLITSYQKLRLKNDAKSDTTQTATLRSRSDATKEVKFRAIVAAIAEELPGLTKICEDCDKHIVQPILSRGTTVLDTRVPGIRMAIGGDLQALRQTPIAELVSTAKLPPLGSIEDPGTPGTEDSAGSEI